MSDKKELIPKDVETPNMLVDISRGKEPTKIPCINEIDNEPIPNDYIYINKNQFTGSNISLDDLQTHFCSCKSVCTTSCDCGRNSITIWYLPDGCLMPHFNFIDSPLIFECNYACQCHKLNCINRVVQKGVQASLQVFKTCEKGWGVKALAPILKGQFVCEYIGEVINEKVANEREDDSYIFDLETMDKKDSFSIDAKFFGNVSRFINHSCVANLTPIRVFVEYYDLRFPRIALFANTNIDINQEISFNYGVDFWNIKYKYFCCQCKSLNCKYSSTNHLKNVTNK